MRARKCIFASLAKLTSVISSPIATAERRHASFRAVIAVATPTKMRNPVAVYVQFAAVAARELRECRVIPRRRGGRHRLFQLLTLRPCIGHVPLKLWTGCMTGERPEVIGAVGFIAPPLSILERLVRRT